MDDQRQWSQAGITAAVGGGFALLLFLLIAGFAGERLVQVERSGWAGLMALLAACTAVFVLCLGWGLRRGWALLAQAVAGSAAGINLERNWYFTLMAVALMLTYGLPPVLVRQTYWSWAPWAALISFVVCLSILVVALRRSHQLADAYYARLSPVELRRELDRLQSGISIKALKRLWLVLFGLFFLSVAILFVGAVAQWMDHNFTFPPRTASAWINLLSPLNMLFVATTSWSNVYLTERWRQRLGSQANT